MFHVEHAGMMHCNISLINCTFHVEQEQALRIK